MYCPNHQYNLEDGSPIIYGSSFLRSLVPSGSKIGYDVITEIGIKRFVEYRQVDEIVQKLHHKKISISSSSVSRWSDYFLSAVECLHNTKIWKLKKLIKENRGYLLHIDATTETKSDTVFVCMDRIIGAVLISEKISSECSEEIEKALLKLKNNFGKPLAVMMDMGGAINSAVYNVFPKVPDRICQFHFLKDIGKELLGDIHVNIGHQLVRQKINSSLQRMKRDLEALLTAGSVEKTCKILNKFKDKELPPSLVKKSEDILTLRYIDWILKFKTEGEGLGFPFDPFRLFFYSRLNKVRLKLSRYNKKHARTLKSCPNLSKLQELLERITDPELRALVRELRVKYKEFQKLRSILKFEVKKKTPLAETMSIGTIKEVKAYNRELLKYTKKLMSKRRKKEISESEDIILKHLETYRYKLPIPEQLAEVLSLEMIDRTNNIEEGLFRDIKRGQRRQVGKKNISHEFSQFGPYLPLIKNLTNEQYVKKIIGRIEDLPIRISELDPKNIAYYQRKLFENRRGKFYKFLNKIEVDILQPKQ